MSFGAVIGLLHVLGAIVSVWVLTHRTGYSGWHGLPARIILISPEWFVTTFLKAFVWEAVLAYWLATGKPASRWGVPHDSRSGRIVRGRHMTDEDTPVRR
ncbi:hypothetical protein NX794_31200 [Streptomyces sp. LP11]|uniref:Uncharacterized protein n=1 Tax=Streptomyces pyxinicus TaxID=2970331 RepID=A0ABT2BAU0_9ACTN|nr:hypothetical protein [Streptomyces sp. LP11]MCS0605636.1 hypothetical protein [Streptomyces sp. LP11]